MTTNNYQWLPMTTKDYQRLSKSIKDYQGLSKTIKDYQRQSKTIKDYQRLFIDLRWLLILCFDSSSDDVVGIVTLMSICVILLVILLVACRENQWPVRHIFTSIVWPTRRQSHIYTIMFVWKLGLEKWLCKWLHLGYWLELGTTSVI